MSKELEIKNLIFPTINNLGYNLVQVQIFYENIMRVQIMVERLDETNITIEDCSIISKEASIILDINEPFGENYLLEVSSPGIDHPLLHLEDFEKYIGFDARVDMKNTLDGRKKFKGTLTGVDGDKIKIRVKEEEYVLSFLQIQKAKLLLTQELLGAVTQN